MPPTVDGSSIEATDSVPSFAKAVPRSRPVGGPSEVHQAPLSGLLQRPRSVANSSRPEGSTDAAKELVKRSESPAACQWFPRSDELYSDTPPAVYPAKSAPLLACRNAGA